MSLEILGAITPGIAKIVALLFRTPYGGICVLLTHLLIVNLAHSYRQHCT